MQARSFQFFLIISAIALTHSIGLLTGSVTFLSTSLSHSIFNLPLIATAATWGLMLGSTSKCISPGS